MEFLNCLMKKNIFLGRDVNIEISLAIQINKFTKRRNK